MADTNQNPSEKKEEDLKVVHPDFIYVDEQHYRQERENQKHQAADLASSKGPIIIRLVCFGAFLSCLLLTAALLVGLVILGLGGLIFLFKNPEINKVIIQYLKYLVSCVVGMLGFLIGVISPVLGFTILVLYFSRSDSAFLRQFVGR